MLSVILEHVVASKSLMLTEYREHGTR
jgi:hypothetical protein